MKKILLILLCLPMIGFSQLKVAILDFENTSGIAKYDGLGKAMSNMLITDLKNNIHPRKIVFMERSQLNKILDEQDIQKSKNFDKSTAVNFGKLAGVDFIIIGSIYVLDKHCNITSRMVNVETSEITDSKEVDGSINNWMTLKSSLAQQFANAVNNPISIENSNQTTSEGVLVQYSKVIKAIDENNVEKAESMISMMKDLGVNFEYLDFLNEDINKLKEQLKELELELEISVTDPIGASNNFYESGDYINSIKYLKVGKKRLEKNDVGGLIYYYLLFHQSYLEIDVQKSLAYCDSILDIYPYFEVALQAKYEALYKNGKYSEALEVIEPIIHNYKKCKRSNYFSSSVNDFMTEKKLERSGAWNCPNGYYIISSYVSGFGLGLNCNNEDHSYEYKQGHNYENHLHWLIECIKKLYNSEEVIRYLDDIQHPTTGYIEDNDEMRKSNPYYIPKSQYASKNNYLKERKLYFAKNNQSFTGDYHETSKGKRWTKKSPAYCPCELLFTEQEMTENNDKGISTDITSIQQFFVEFALGWYYLKNNQPKETITTYIKILDYFEEYHHHWVYSYQKLEDNERYIMSTINLGHGYLLSGDMIKAKEIYKKYNLNTSFSEDWNSLTVKGVYLQDWEEFYNDGILSEKDFILIKNELKIK